MKCQRWLAAFSLAALAGPPVHVTAARPPGVEQQKGEFLTEEEQDKLREAQNPSDRIEVYLTLAQTRLDRFEEYRKKPADPRYDTAAFLDSLLDHYVSLNEELKNWIQDQYERNGDMRKGLRLLLARGPKQLDQLRHIEQSADPYAANYKDNLRDAIEELTDTLDGGTKALADQEKKLAQAKHEEKADAQALKEKRKEEEKRNKEENRLRKKQRKHTPNDSDDN